MAKVSAVRYHDISCGHRVSGHEGKCANLHGHEYRIHFHCEGELDGIGRVLDFSVIKQKLCMWLEENWDHKFLAWEKDEAFRELSELVSKYSFPARTRFTAALLGDSIVWVPFNPTAENIAQYLVEVIGPQLLVGTGVRVTKCVVEETRKCAAEFSI